MNRTFYHYRLETAGVTAVPYEACAVLRGGAGNILRISLPADDARRLINSWGELLPEDQQRYDYEPEAWANATATIPGTDGQPDREVPARVHISRSFVRDDAKASPAGTPGKADTVGDDFFSMWVGTYDGEARLDQADAKPERTCCLYFTDAGGDRHEIFFTMADFRKLRSAMLSVDEDGNAIDPARSEDDSEIDAVVSALAALTDRVRALEERGAKPIDPEQVLDALRSKATRSFKEPRT